MKPLIRSILACTLMIGPCALAQSPNEFSGPGCASHGTWTQNALVETQNIGQIINNLKDNPDCRGIGEAIAGLQVASGQIGDASSGASSSDPNASQNESDAKDLKLIGSNAIQPDGSINNDVSQTLLTGVLNLALNSSFLPAKFAQNFPTSSLGQVNNFAKMFNRTAFVAEQGMNALSSVMKVVPQYTQCLIGHPNEGMLLVSGLVKMTASLSNSGGGTNNAIGTALAGLAEMMAKQKFALALRTTNRVAFDNSVSCLMETVSQHWCEVDNAQRVMEYFKNERAREMRRQTAMKSEGAFRRTNGKELPLFRNNPLNGYYLLTRELPIITEWLQKVQIGANPRLSTDAEFQNKVIDTTNNMIKLTKTIQGQYSEDMQVLATFAGKPVEMQKNQLFNALNRLVGNLTQGGQNDGSSGGSSIEFITNSVNAQLVPYKLIGIDSLPTEATGSQANSIPWQSWMQKNKNFNNGYVPQFNDPMALSRTIQTNMNAILDDAAKNASAYYQNFLIVDQVNLVNETSIGPVLTVRGAFQNIYLYLSGLEKEFRNSGQSPATLGSIIDLKLRIRKYMLAFEKYEQVVADIDSQVSDTLQFKDSKTRKKALSEVNISKELQDAADEVINVTYDQFMVQKAKDSFVSTRLKTFIQMDLKNRIEESKDKLTAAVLSNTQKTLLNYTLKVMADDPTLSTLDLAQSKMIESKNLSVISNVFRDSLYAMIIENKAFIKGWSAVELAQHIKRKLAADAPHSLKNMLMPYLAWTDGSSTHPDLYADLTMLQRGTLPKNDQYRSGETVRGLYCALSLSLNNRGYFLDACKGAVLPTFYDEQKKDLNLNYDDYLPNHEKAHAISTNPLLYTSTVCSFNRYLAFNRLAFLKDQEKNSSPVDVSDRADQTQDVFDQADQEALHKH